MHTAAVLLLAATVPAADPASGDGVIRGKAGTSEIVLTTTARVAGAVHSLTWGGKEFVDSADHGRQIQSASNFDAGARFVPEVFNPTEAGSAADGAGPTSTSRMLKFKADGVELEAVNRMAFWLAPGEKSAGHPARNTKKLSDHLLSKRVRIGEKDLPHAIRFDVTFTVPEGEGHRYAQFEALTGYMPPAFGVFRRFVPATGKLEPLDDGPGEQADPVVFLTEEGGHAMGVWSPDQPSAGFEKAGYGRFRFKAEKVVKWNCVFRVRDPKGVPAGDHHYRVYVAVGTAEDVRSTLASLTERAKQP
jgi:hypothetical protein